jgi:hypothetical protein
MLAAANVTACAPGAQPRIHTETPSAAVAPAPATNSPPASAVEPPGLAARYCSAQMASDLETYASGDVVSFRFVLLPADTRASQAPVPTPTQAALITDRGSIPLTVVGVTADDLMVSSSRSIHMELPPLSPGVYSSDEVSLVFGSADIRLKIGRWRISVRAGTAPKDLGVVGTPDVIEGVEGPIGGIPLTVSNASTGVITLANAKADVPGRPISWSLVALGGSRDMTLLPGEHMDVSMASSDSLAPLRFAYVTPVIGYQAPQKPSLQLALNPLLFTSGFGSEWASGDYVKQLPDGACAFLPG